MINIITVKQALTMCSLIIIHFSIKYVSGGGNMALVFLPQSVCLPPDFQQLIKKYRRAKRQKC